MKPRKWLDGSRYTYWSRPEEPSTAPPSINSPRRGKSRHNWPSPTTNGATTTMPTPSDRNHVRQTSQNGAVVWNMVIVAAPPTAEAAAARPAAAKKPKTRRRSPKPNAGPNQRSSSQATRIASPALQKPLNIEVMKTPVLQEVSSDGADQPRQSLVLNTHAGLTRSRSQQRRQTRAKIQPRLRAAPERRVQAWLSGNRQ